jgi:hypothetical protein
MKREAAARDPTHLKKTLTSVTKVTGLSERSFGRTMKEIRTRESGVWTPRLFIRKDL